MGVIDALRGLSRVRLRIREYTRSRVGRALR